MRAREDLPLVSVLMTAYNREAYIAEAIESVLASTYKNFELIIVDDCSRDRTLEIARSYAKQDSRIKFFTNERNLGDYPNRNKAASLALGKYLKYIDADDLIYPYGLEILVDMMEKFPNSGWGLCSLKQDKFKIFPFELAPIEAYRYGLFGPGLFHKAPLSSIIKRDAFEKLGGFRNLRLAGDQDMWLRLACVFPVVLMPIGIVWYRVHEGQEASYIDLYAGAYEKVLIQNVASANCPLAPLEKRKFLSLRRRKLIREMLKCMLKLDRKNIVPIIERLNEHYHR